MTLTKPEWDWNWTFLFHFTRSTANEILFGCFFATKLVFHCKVCSQKQLLVIAVTLIFKIAAKKLRSDKKELHWPPFLIVAIDLVFICFLKWEEFLKESARFIWIFIFNFKIRSHNFKEIKYLQSWQNETLPQYHESKLGFFKEINRALDSKEIFSSVWSWGTFQTLDILLQISWKLQTENCVSSREGEEIWRRSKFLEEHRHQ